MRSIFICIAVLGISVRAKDYQFNRGDNPIQVVKTSIGRGGHERIVYLYADIFPNHLTTNDRMNFSTSGEVQTYFEAIKADGDERGYLVGPQFSGQPKWFNLSPQNIRVNRNAGYRSITTSWYGIECEVKKFLIPHSKRHVTWRVNMLFMGNSNRPHAYHLQVEFFDANKSLKWIDTHIRNPLKKQDSTFWICRGCSTYRSPNCSRSPA